MAKREDGCLLSTATVGIKSAARKKLRGIEVLCNEFRPHSRHEENLKILLEAIAASFTVIHDFD